MEIRETNERKKLCFFVKEYRRPTNKEKGLNMLSSLQLVIRKGNAPLATHLAPAKGI